MNRILSISLCVAIALTLSCRPGTERPGAESANDIPVGVYAASSGSEAAFGQATVQGEQLPVHPDQALAAGQLLGDVLGPGLLQGFLLLLEGSANANVFFRRPLGLGFNRTPAPPLSESMNSTPSFSKTAVSASIVSTRTADRFPSIFSKRLTVSTETPAADARAA